MKIDALESRVLHISLLMQIAQTMLESHVPSKDAKESILKIVKDKRVSSDEADVVFDIYGMRQSEHSKYFSDCNAEEIKYALSLVTGLTTTARSPLYNYDNWLVEAKSILRAVLNHNKISNTSEVLITRIIELRFGIAQLSSVINEAKQRGSADIDICNGLSETIMKLEKHGVQRNSIRLLKRIFSIKQVERTKTELKSTRAVTDNDLDGTYDKLKEKYMSKLSRSFGLDGYGLVLTILKSYEVQPRNTEPSLQEFNEILKTKGVQVLTELKEAYKIELCNLKIGVGRISDHLNESVIFGSFAADAYISCVDLAGRINRVKLFRGAGRISEIQNIRQKHIDLRALRLLNNWDNLINPHIVFKHTQSPEDMPAQYIDILSKYESVISKIDRVLALNSYTAATACNRHKRKRQMDTGYDSRTPNEFVDSRTGLTKPL